MNKPHHVVIYSMVNCRQCDMTEKKMIKDEIPFVNNHYGNEEETNEIDLNSSDPKKRAWSEAKVEKIKDKYKISGLPLVKVLDENGITLDYWSGFRPQNLDKWFPKPK